MGALGDPFLYTISLNTWAQWAQKLFATMELIGLEELLVLAELL